MTTTPDIKPRSRDVTDGLEKAAARGMLRAVGMGDEHGPVSGGPHPHDRHEHLVLSAPPRARGIDVQREHQLRPASRPGGVRWSSHNFACFRKT